MAEPHLGQINGCAEKGQVLKMVQGERGRRSQDRAIGLKSKQTTLPTNHCILIPDIPVLGNASILGKEPPNLLLRLQHSGDGTHCL